MTGGVQVRVERLPFRFATGVWFWRPTRGGVAIMQFGEHGWYEADRPNGVSADDVRPSIELPDDLVEPLLRALSDVAPASDATVDHLRDAVGVRDRLLALVEHLTDRGHA